LDADHPENGVLIPCLFTPRPAQGGFRLLRVEQGRVSVAAGGGEHGIACGRLAVAADGLERVARQPSLYRAGLAKWEKVVFS
jgi:hypothetical protein